MHLSKIKILFLALIETVGQEVYLCLNDEMTEGVFLIRNVNWGIFLKAFIETVYLGWENFHLVLGITRYEEKIFCRFYYIVIAGMVTRLIFIVAMRVPIFYGL